MKKREITNNDLEQLFSQIIEQTPLVSEEQVNSLLIDLPAAKPAGALKRFFQYRLNTLFFVAVVFGIVAIIYFSINPVERSVEPVTQINPQENVTTPLSADSTQKQALQPAEEASENETSSVVVQTESAVSLSDVYKHFDKKPQIFSVKADRDTTITCKEGTTIKIKANSFIVEKTGEPVTGTVKLAVKEYYKSSDMVLGNLTTTSDNKILETGGMLNISAKSGRKNCNLNPGKNIEIGFPYSERKNDMALFYGEQAGDLINWKLATNYGDVEVEDELRIEDTEAGDNTIIDIAPVVVQKEEVEQPPTYFIVEEMPEFPGGQKALEKYLAQKAFYPYSMLDSNIQGKVYVTFEIDTKGDIRNINVVRGLDKTLDKAAAFIVSKMPKWKPGKQRGEPVNVSYTVSIKFAKKQGKLTDEEINQAKLLDEELKNFRYDFYLRSSLTDEEKNQEFEEKVKDGNFKETNVDEVNRYIFSATQLGWINCDRFYNKNYYLVNFYILSDNSDKIKVTGIINRAKSLIKGRMESGRIAFKNIPSGATVTIVALKTSNDKILLAVKETKVTANGEISLDFQPVTLELLQKEMEKLNELY